MKLDYDGDPTSKNYDKQNYKIKEKHKVHTGKKSKTNKPSHNVHMGFGSSTNE